jgi:hypothetical protein
MHLGGQARRQAKKVEGVAERGGWFEAQQLGAKPIIQSEVFFTMLGLRPSFVLGDSFRRALTYSSANVGGRNLHRFVGEEVNTNNHN